MEKEKILKELIQIYTDYRDHYDGKKFKIEMNEGFSMDYGYENMWWVNLEIVDNMWKDILKLFKDKEVEKEFDKLRKRLHNEWKDRQNKFGDWRDLPEKNEKQCEFCGKFFLDLEKHKNKMHGGKEQVKLS